MLPQSFCSRRSLRCETGRAERRRTPLSRGLMRGPGNGWGPDQAAITITAMAMARGMRAVTAVMWAATAADLGQAIVSRNAGYWRERHVQAPQPRRDDLPGPPLRVVAGQRLACSGPRRHRHVAGVVLNALASSARIRGIRADVIAWRQSRDRGSARWTRDRLNRRHGISPWAPRLRQ